MSATVDMEAIYTTRAAPYNLYPDNDDKKEALKKRIPVECQLNLLGELAISHHRHGNKYAHCRCRDQESS